jgi:predicted dehydrogenase
LKVRYGMVGGGPGAFIGEVHRMAARLDGEWELAAGAFSSDPEKSARTGAALGLDASRVYGSYQEMAEAEGSLAESERIDAVAIVTPNHLHHPVAKAFLDHDVHVVCDKPLTTTVGDAEELCRLAAEGDRVFAVTHNYTGYPMVKEARERVRRGDLGDVRRIVVEYAQGWLRTLLEAEGHKQAEWRGDPERAGISSALGDIGSHAHNLIRYVTGLEVDRLLADLGTVVEGRDMEDDAAVILQMQGGARGVLLASQISTGERNRLRLRVYGSDAGLEWSQEEPDRLRLVEPDGDERILYRGDPTLSEAARVATRLPGGHPEGFIEAFANVYRGVARALRGDEGPLDFPTVQDGAFGVHFIHQAVASSETGQWVDMGYVPPGA